MVPIVLTVLLDHKELMVLTVLTEQVELTDLTGADGADGTDGAGGTGPDGLRTWGRWLMVDHKFGTDGPSGAAGT